MEYIPSQYFQVPLPKMSVFVKINEPDIFLVEDIDDVNSDALMLNTELQFKMWSQVALNVVNAVSNVVDNNVANG